MSETLLFGARRSPAASALAALLLALLASRARAQDPSRTLTVFVGGFNNSGATSHGVFGVDGSESLLDSLAALVGSPVAHGEPTLPMNASGAAIYYGDTPPAYYTDADVAELTQVTAQWHGGVPRYALIVAPCAASRATRIAASSGTAAASRACRCPRASTSIASSPRTARGRGGA